MKLVSPFLKKVVFPVLSRSGYLRLTAGEGPAVVTYHGVFPAGYVPMDRNLDGNLVHAEALRQQLQMLKKRYRVISPDDFRDWVEGKVSLPARSVLLTCDDALRNSVTEMLPILREMGMFCLFFATGAPLAETATPTMLWYEELYLMLLDAGEQLTLRLPGAGIDLAVAAKKEIHSVWWSLVERLSAFDGRSRQVFLDQVRRQLKLPERWRERFADTALASRFMTLDITGLRELAGAGMTIGAHSLSHPILAKVSAELAWQEISESRHMIERAVGQTVWAFAYPFGNAATVSEREVRLAEEAGFRSAFMNEAGGFGAKIGRYSVPRVHVTADMSLAEFEAHLSGFYRSIRRGWGR